MMISNNYRIKEDKNMAKQNFELRRMIINILRKAMDTNGLTVTEIYDQVQEHGPAKTTRRMVERMLDELEEECSVNVDTESVAKYSLLSKDVCRLSVATKKDIEILNLLLKAVEGINVSGFDDEIISLIDHAKKFEKDRRKYNGK